MCVTVRKRASEWGYNCAMSETNIAERRVAITADTRERGKITKVLEGIPGVALSFAELECGDYLLGAGVAVERKSATDFILSVVDASLVEKVARLKASVDRPIYIVEAGTRDLFTARFHQKAFDVHGALSYMSVIAQVPVLSTPDYEQSAMLIYFLAVDAQYRLGAKLNTRVNKPEVRADAQQYLLQGLPGVDAERAEALLKRFGSVAAVLNAPVAEWARVAGLDDETAAFVQEVLTARWP